MTCFRSKRPSPHINDLRISYRSPIVTQRSLKYKHKTKPYKLRHMCVEIYFLFIICLCVFAVVITIIVVHLHLRAEKKTVTTMPAWVSRHCQTTLPMCVQSSYKNVVIHHHRRRRRRDHYRHHLIHSLSTTDSTCSSKTYLLNVLMILYTSWQLCVMSCYSI